MHNLVPFSRDKGILPDWSPGARQFVENFPQKKLRACIDTRCDKTKRMFVTLIEDECAGISVNVTMKGNGLAAEATELAKVERLSHSVLQWLPQPSLDPILQQQQRSPGRPLQQQQPQQQQRQQQNQQQQNPNNPSTPRALTSSAHVSPPVSSSSAFAHPAANNPVKSPPRQKPRAFSDLPTPAVGRVDDVMIAWMKDPQEIYVQLVAQEDQLQVKSRRYAFFTPSVGWGPLLDRQ